MPCVGTKDVTGYVSHIGFQDAVGVLRLGRSDGGKYWSTSRRTKEIVSLMERSGRWRCRGNRLLDQVPREVANSRLRVPQDSAKRVAHEWRGEGRMKVLKGKSSAIALCLTTKFGSVAKRRFEPSTTERMHDIESVSWQPSLADAIETEDGERGEAD